MTTTAAVPVAAGRSSRCAPADSSPSPLGLLGSVDVGRSAVRTTRTTPKGRRADFDPSLDFTDAEAVARALGMVSVSDCPCPLPGHEDLARAAGFRVDLPERPSPSEEARYRLARSVAASGLASLEFDDRRGEFRLVCDCTGTPLCTGEVTEFSRSLPDVFWSLETRMVLGRHTRLPGPTRAVARLLLAHRAGQIQPELSSMPLLPEDAPESARRARDLFGRLYGLRMATRRDDVSERGMQFSRSFVANLLQVPDHEARVALELLGEHVLEKVGERPKRDKPGGGWEFYGAYWYRPGQVTEVEPDCGVDADLAKPQPVPTGGKSGDDPPVNPATTSSATRAALLTRRLVVAGNPAVPISVHRGSGPHQPPHQPPRRRADPAAGSRPAGRP